MTQDKKNPFDKPRRMLTNLRWRETSGVDHPANEEEGWMVMKAMGTALEDMLKEEADFQKNGERVLAILNAFDFSEAPKSVQTASRVMAQWLTEEVGASEKAEHKECPPGEEYDEASGKCVPMKQARGKKPGEEYKGKSLEELLAEDDDDDVGKAKAKAEHDCPPGEEWDEGKQACVATMRRSTRKQGQLIQSLLSAIQNKGATEKRGPTEKQIQEAIQSNWPDFLKEMKAIMKSEDGNRKSQAFETVKDFQGAVERDLIAATK